MSGKERIEGSVPLLDDWLFGPSQHGVPADSVPDSDLSTVQLPHNAARLSWKEWDPASWERTWLYRKHFRITRDSGQRHFLNFGAALTVTTPTLNRQPLPAHPGGYSPFQYEITEHVLAENTLDVLLDGRFVRTVPPNWDDAPSTSVDFWQPAGLYRPVTLLSVPTEHIADVFAKPHDVLDPAQRGVDVRCTLDIGEGGHALWVHAELSDGGTVISEATTEVTDPSAGRHPVHLRLGGLERVELWSPDSPKLYDVVVTLSDGTNRIHSYRVRTGLRHARFENSGFYLNGQRHQLFGLSRHQLYPSVGAAMPARAQRRDIELLRNELNCNMIRFSTYPHHEDLLDLCDELGVLVWDEPPGWQFLGTGEWLDNAYRDVRDMILRDRNHPCVVLWAARLNETPGNAEYYSETQKLAKSLDDSRQTTGAMLAADHDTTDFQQDVFGYNDYANSTGPDGQRRPELMPPRTDLPYLVSEAVGTLSGPAKFYRRTDPQPVQQGQALAHARVHDLARAHAAYAGVIGWVGIDYQSGNGNIDRGLKWPGVIDVFRVPKRGASVYRAQVDPRERIVLEPSFYWDFHPRGPVNELGDRAAIWSNVDRLELFLDGYHHQTAHPASDEFARLPHPPFFADFSRVQPSDLRIDAYLADELVYTRRFTADRTKDRLRLTVDDPELLVGGSDATRVEFRAVDAYGADRPHVDGELTFELHGPAELLGDNPFPMDETGGAGAVWLRSIPDRTGEVRLRAHHPVLGDAEVGLIVMSA